MSPRASIIIADLDRHLRGSLRVQLDELGFTCFIASDAQEAVDLATRHVPSFVILDTALPCLGAYEACAQIRRLPDCRQVPILLVASTDQPKIHTAARHAGANAVLVKPSVNALLRTLESLVAVAGLTGPAGQITSQSVASRGASGPARAGEALRKVWAPAPATDLRPPDGSMFAQGRDMLSVMRQRETKRGP